MMPKYIKELYYITHIDNLNSILNNGIYSHRFIEEKSIQFTPVYDKSIVSNRSKKVVTTSTTLWDYANLYFQSRNPMLYRVVHEKGFENIVVIGVKRDIMNFDGVFLTNGNAASPATAFLQKSKVKKKNIETLAEITQDIPYWKDDDGSKRKIMAECLVPEIIPTDFLQTIYVANLRVQKIVLDKINGKLPVIPQPDMFFGPIRMVNLTDNLKLVEGDMFFSKLQTLTISVNCKGVMGKGLASRTKYQFPRVYVYYEDICKSKKLRMGKPVLYKQEQSIDFELADEPASMANGLVETWFLLFPTKDNWRNKADINGIREGLKWIVDNYRKEGIKSLALPALGCGLGWLDWSEVGPLMCNTLKDLDIETWIHLPTEKRIPEDQLQRDYLIK